MSRIPSYTFAGLLILLLGAASVACSSGAPQVEARATTPFDHIYVLLMENRSFDEIIGNTEAPYLNKLYQEYGLATNYTAAAHPSQPNYIALFSGSTLGVTNDALYNLQGRSLFDQLEEHGKTWRVFAQNMPPNCFAGETASGGADGAGSYARRHNPAISYDSIRESPARCANITDWSHFDPAAANLQVLLPNDCNNMHDCTTSEGDQFLSNFVPRILSSPAWQQSGVLFIVWDEGKKSDKEGGGGRVALLVVSNHMLKPFQSPIPHNTYSLLRTIQDNWDLGCLNESCSALPLREFFIAAK